MPASWLLGLLAVASVAVVAGGRMAEQVKRVGLLKAAGGSPPLAAAVLLAEHLTALYGAVQSGGPQGSPPTWWLLAMVAGMLVVVAALTAIPARVGARRPGAEILQAELA